MLPAPRALPRPSALQATLRKITEALANELACPKERAPEWSPFEWVVARAVAAMHGVSPLLSRALRWQGPGDWAQFLDAQRAHTAQRHARVEELLQSIDRRAREDGIAALALKGVALHALGLYAPGERPMADIDVLVRPRDAERTAALFRSLGFHESSKTWKERGFAPVVQHRPNDLGEHGANDLKLELHERICERLPWRLTDVSDRVFPRIPQPGLNTYATTAALMTHLLLHAAGSMASQSLRLLQLHDIALLSARMSELDWHEFTASSRCGAGLWWAFPPLQMCARYYASHIPSRVLTGLAEACPYWLAKTSRGKNLYDVSYSYLWVDAFPGMEWSRSMREVFDYALSRVRPGTVHLAARGRIAKSEVWSHHSRWPQMSQSRRIVHWITSRPTRPLTMHAVRSALAQSP